MDSKWGNIKSPCNPWLQMTIYMGHRIIGRLGTEPVLLRFKGDSQCQSLQGHHSLLRCFTNVSIVVHKSIADVNVLFDTALGVI